MTRDLTSGSPLKVIALFTLPLVLGNLFQQFYSLADTIIVGRFVGVSALASVFHVKPGPDPRRPPRAAMQFEVAASLFALARLLSDMWPTLRTITDTVAMAAMAIGFALVLQFVLKLKQPEE